MGIKAIQGRPTATPPERGTSLAKFSVRPQRLAFIIHTSLGRKQIEEIILYNTWTWGGFYNVLVPCSPAGISEDYRRMLLGYDPDRLIFCGRVPAAVRKNLIDYIQPFNSINLESLLPTKEDRRNYINNISTPQVLVREVNALKGESASRVRFPSVPQSSLFRPYVITHLGLLDENLRRFNEDGLNAQCVDFSGTSSLGKYLSLLDECLENLYPIQLTQRHLNPTYQVARPADAVIVFGEPYEVEGICMFWNWRMDASKVLSYPPHEAFAFLPPQSVKQKTGLEELATWIRAKRRHGGVTLLAPPALRPFLHKLKTRLTPLLGSDFTHIDIAQIANYIPVTKYPESEVTKEIGWSDNETIFEAPLPEFDLELLNDEAWVVDCDLSDFRTQRQSYFPPRRPGQVEVLEKCTYGKFAPLYIYGGPWRFSGQGVACLTTVKRRLHKLRVPEPEAIFEPILSQAGYDFKVSDKCGYVRSTIDILNKACQQKILRKKGFRHLFYQMADGRPLTRDQIRSLVKPGEDTGELDDFLLSMLSVNGFFRGATYRCPSCGVSSWHHVAALSEILTCPGCARSLQPPLEFLYSFKMSTLLETTVKQGGIPVILTEGVLRNLARKTRYTIPGVIATDSKGAQVDIDILASCDGHVVCVECKTLDKEPKSSSITRIVEQLEKDYELAARLDADVFAVSLLSNNVPDKIRAFVRRKNRQARGPFAVVIKLADMERGYLIRTCVDPHARSGLEDRPIIEMKELLDFGRVNGFRV